MENYYCNECDSEVEPNQPACKCGSKQAYVADNPKRKRKMDLKEALSIADGVLSHVIENERMYEKLLDHLDINVESIEDAIKAMESWNLSIHHNPRSLRFHTARTGTSGKTRGAETTKSYHSVAGYQKRYPKVDKSRKAGL